MKKTPPDNPTEEVVSISIGEEPSDSPTEASLALGNYLDSKNGYHAVLAIRKFAASGKAIPEELLEWLYKALDCWIENSPREKKKGLRYDKLQYKLGDMAHIVKYLGFTVEQAAERIADEEYKKETLIEYYKKQPGQAARRRVEAAVSTLRELVTIGELDEHQCEVDREEKRKKLRKKLGIEAEWIASQQRNKRDSYLRSAYEKLCKINKYPKEMLIKHLTKARNNYSIWNEFGPPTDADDVDIDLFNAFDCGVEVPRDRQEILRIIKKT